MVLFFLWLIWICASLRNKECLVTPHISFSTHHLLPSDVVYECSPCPFGGAIRMVQPVDLFHSHSILTSPLPCSSGRINSYCAIKRANVTCSSLNVADVWFSRLINLCSCQLSLSGLCGNLRWQWCHAHNSISLRLVLRWMLVRWDVKDVPLKVQLTCPYPHRSPLPCTFSLTALGLIRIGV